MAKTKSVGAQIRTMVNRIEGQIDKLKRLAPREVHDEQPTEDARVLTWRMAIRALDGARECVDDVAAELEFGDENVTAGAAVGDGGESSIEVEVVT